MYWSLGSKMVVQRGWIKVGHIWGDVLGPYSGSRMAIGGRHRASKWLKLAINGRASGKLVTLRCNDRETL